MKFSLLDLVFLGGILLAAYLGYRGGAFRKGIMLLGMVAGIYLSARLTSAVAPLLMRVGLGRTAAEITAFTLLFVLLMVILYLLYKRFGKSGAGRLSSRLIGAAFGVIQGVLVLSFILLAMNVIGFPDKGTRKDSVLYQPIAQVLPRAFGFLQAHLPGVGEVKEELRNVL